MSLLLRAPPIFVLALLVAVAAQADDASRGAVAAQVAATEGDTSQRGLLFGQQTPERARTGRSVVVTIGIDQYEHWPELRNAVWDAKTVLRILTEQFGFVILAEPLFNENATRDKIAALIQDTLRKDLKADDELLFFFAGHGTMRAGQVGGQRQIEEGYLVPVEAPCGKDEKLSKYLQIDSLLKDLGNLPSRHVLAILDSCHSGFALSQKFRGAPAQRFTEDLAGRISRRVISSARKDQRALDGGPKSNHSLFAGMLLDGLRSGGSDLDHNGWITSSELGLFLQQNVGQQSESKQTPGSTTFQLDQGGEMLIAAPQHRSTEGTTEREAKPVIADRVKQILPRLHHDDIDAIVCQIAQQRVEACRKLEAWRRAKKKNHLESQPELGRLKLDLKQTDGQWPTCRARIMERLGIEDENLISASKTPKTAGEFLSRGRSFLVSGDMDQAVADFSAAIQLEPKGATYFQHRGIAHQLCGGFKEAVDDFGEAARIDSDFAKAYLGRGLAYRMAQKSEEALKDIEAAIQRDRNDAEAHLQKAWIHEVGESWEAALHAYDEAIRCAPKHRRAHLGKGFVQILLGKLENGLTTYDTMIQFACDCSEAYNNRGVAAELLGKVDQAITDYSEAIRLNPTDAVAYYNRGMAYSTKRELEKAVRDYSQALRLKPNFASAYFERGRAYAELAANGSDVQVVVHKFVCESKVKTVTDEDGTYLLPYTVGKSVATRANALDQALEDSTAAIRLAPYCGEYYCQRGRTHESRQDLLLASADCTTTIALGSMYRNRSTKVCAPKFAPGHEHPITSLRPGDVILEVNGWKITNLGEYWAAVNISPWIMHFSIRRAGSVIHMATLLEKEGPRFGVVASDDNGIDVQVVDVQKGSPGSRATVVGQGPPTMSLRPGDVITSINGRAIADTDDYWTAVKRSPRNMQFTIKRGAREFNLKATLRNGNGSRFGVVASDMRGPGVRVVDVSEGYPGDCVEICK